MKNMEVRQFIIPNLPYAFVFWFFSKAAEGYRLCGGTNMVEKMMGMLSGLGDIITHDPLPSFHPYDLLAGVCGAAVVWAAVYFKRKNAKKFRHGVEYGSARWGAAKDMENVIYMTVGTGIGVGVYLNGALLHGLIHPEAGHILLTKHPEDLYEGCCPFHKNCAEGLASGPALEGRWGRKAAELAGREKVWELEAYYIAQAVTDYILAYSPQKIILWGGVMHQKNLFALVRKGVKQFLNGYISHELLGDSIEEYIVPPALGEDPGILGAIKLGMLAG